MIKEILSSMTCHRMLFSLLFSSIFDPTSITFLTIPLLCLSLYALFTLTKQMIRTQLIDYYWSLTNRSTWLLTSQNNPVPFPQPALVQEPSWPLSSAPTTQSSGLPGHGVQVGVRPPHEVPCSSQGSLSVPQHEQPDQLPPFNELRPRILRGTRQTQLEQGRSLHQPPDSQQHRPTESL